MIKLRDYLYDKGIMQDAFAKTLGVSRSHLSVVLLGRKPMSKRLAKSIELETEGVIKHEDILSGEALGYEGKGKRVRLPSKIVRKPKKIKPKRIRYEYKTRFGNKILCKNSYSLI